MAWDIYGNRLRKGFCEVHPWVGEEYPCSLCNQDIDKRKREQQEYDAYCRAEQKAYAESFVENTDGGGI
jgi:hypothetical protein